MGPSIDYFVAAPAVNRSENKVRWRQHTHRSVETSHVVIRAIHPGPKKEH